MTKTIDQHEGKKYLRTVASALDGRQRVQIDVYAVLKAFGVTCPARSHAIKKLLCCGSRGKGNELADLLGAEAAVSRAIELCRDQIRETGVSSHNSLLVDPDRVVTPGCESATVQCNPLVPYLNPDVATEPTRPLDTDLRQYTTTEPPKEV